jgi:hypothetical protein
MTTPARQYERRDIEALGEDYMRHLSAMTAERLHEKSDIAAELAFRDVELRTRAELAEVRRRTAQRCAEIADTHKLMWERQSKRDAAQASGNPRDRRVAANAAKLIAKMIRAEFALAEQPPQPQAQQQARTGECLHLNSRVCSDSGIATCDECGATCKVSRTSYGGIQRDTPWTNDAQPVSPPAQDAGDAHDSDYPLERTK